MDVSSYMVTITKIVENKGVLCEKFNNLRAFATKPIPLDNLPAISSMFLPCFGVYINTLTVSIAHFINDTLISRATWMTVFHLVTS